MEKRSKTQREIDNRELSSHIQVQIEAESRNLFKNEVTRRHRMSSGGRQITLLAIILVALFAVSIFLVPVGNLSFEGWRMNVMSNFTRIFSMGITGRWRLCAFAAMVLVGMALAATGACFQGIFQNPMASPTTLGVEAGGMLGGLVYILFFLGGSTLSFYTEHLDVYGQNGEAVFSAMGDEILLYYDSISQTEKFALEIWEVVGCFFGVALVVGIAIIAGKGKINTLFLMLAGSIFEIVVNEVGQTVQYIILYNHPEEIDDVRYNLIARLLGSSSTLDSNILPTDQFLWMAIPVAAGLILLFSMAGRLNVLMFGEAEAKVMGIPVQTYRILFIVICTLLCGVVISFIGQVSMLGFMIPHLARYMVGPDFKTLVPASALLGGITTLLIWDFCSIVNNLEGFNLYTGVVCGVLSVFFILLYRRQRHASWT